MTSIPPRWTLLDVKQHEIEGGFQIVAYTDVPCHLWLIWTRKEPWYHPKTEILRGLATLADIRVCFVVPHANEQEEPGDTLIHTFTKTEWPICETRWYYFSGTVDGVDSPSNTPVFEKHRTIPFMVLIFTEPWTRLWIDPPDYTMIYYEPWTEP